MHLVYIDDSGDEQLSCYSALIVPAKDWNDCAAALHQMRLDMKAKRGIYTTIELHATDFIGGRKKIADRVVERPERVLIARGILRRIAKMPGLQIINAVMDKSKRAWCFERLLNRIQKNMEKEKSYAMLISDDDKNYNAMLARMRKNNPIPSKYGGWGPSGFQRADILITRIVDQIAYRDSKICPFVQAADFAAYALLRKESQLDSQGGRGLETLYQDLRPAYCLSANKSDPDGIVREGKV